MHDKERRGEKQNKGYERSENSVVRRMGVVRGEVCGEWSELEEEEEEGEGEAWRDKEGEGWRKEGE